MSERATYSPQATERAYSPKQVAELWGLSDDTVRSLFSREPGVIRFQGEQKKRTTLRIPESVMERVKRRLSATPYQGESDAVSKARQGMHRRTKESGSPPMQVSDLDPQSDKRGKGPKKPENVGLGEGAKSYRSLGEW